MKTKIATPQTIKLSDISIKSNTREVIEDDELIELSNSIRDNGLLQAIGLNFTNGKHEIIYGHRRFVGSVKVQIAVPERDSVNALVYENLTDEEVLELQIIENLHRKDIHAIEEAIAYKRLIDFKNYDVQEIALRVAKSVSYVVQRLKLNDLYSEFKTAFLKDRMNLTTALKVCKISLEDQEAFWSEDFSHLNETDSIDVEDRDLKTYMNNLNNAPFDTKDPLIIAKMGACGTCPFNTAVNTFLFPDEAKTSTCTNSTCFQEKAVLSFDLKLKEAIENPEMELISTSHEGMNALCTELMNQGHKIFDRNSFDVIDPPAVIDYSDYEEEYENEYYDSKEEMETAYNEAVKEYEEELKAYEEKISAGKFIKAFVLTGNKKGESVFIELTKEKEGKQTSKGLQEKIKSGVVTDEDIKTEIKRITANEIRKKELEEEKVQPLIFETFEKNKEFISSAPPLNIQEKIGMILMLVDYGGYKMEKEIYKLGNIKNKNSHKIYLYKALVEMSESDLDELYNLCVRSLVIDKMRPGKTSRPSNNALIASFNDIVNSYNKTALADAWANQLLERDKREARVKERIAELTSKLKGKSKKQIKQAA